MLAFDGKNLKQGYFRLRNGYLLYFDMVSWDLVVDKNGEIILIEVNLIYQGISFWQALHGPLFLGILMKIFLSEYLKVNNTCCNRIYRFKI